MGLPKDFHKLDLYGILGIQEDADEKQVTKAYRKKALKCHPDKNPNNTKAAEEFHKISLALEILTDISARAAYDKVVRSRKAANRRHQELDSRRKKFKEDLEARERAGHDQRRSDVDARTRLQQEIERLRKEGSRLLEAQQRLVEEEIRREEHKSHKRRHTHADAVSPKFKVSWNGKIGDNGGYNEDVLTHIFSSYGDVSHVLMSAKSGRALVEFKTLDSMNVTSERGTNTENPLSVRWLEGQSTVDTPDTSTHTPDSSTPTERSTWHTRTEHAPPDVTSDVDDNPTRNERDFESLVMRKLRQAEERKKLIDDMTREDNDPL